MKNDLTERQQSILREIRRFTLIHGYSPTLQELGEKIGTRSLTGVVDYLQVLEKKGYLIRKDKKSRMIQLAESAASLKLPAIGLQNGRITKNIPACWIKTIQSVRFFRKSYSFFFIQDDSFPPYHSGDVLLVQCSRRRPSASQFFHWNLSESGEPSITVLTDLPTHPSSRCTHYFAECIAILDTQSN